MIARGNPFPNGTAYSLKVADREIDQLCRGIVGWEAAARFGGFSDHAVQAFDGIRGVDDFAHIWWEGKEWDDLLPCAPPAWGD